MSLNKWKPWPVENSEDMLKIDKNLVTMKRGSRDQFLAKIKFFETRLFHFCSFSFLSIFGLSIFFWDSLTFSFYFFDIFSSLWSTKEVTTENISINKWKAWPMENSKDVLKIDKKLATTKRGSCHQFFAKIKISNLGEAEYVSRVRVLVVGLFTFQVPDVSSDVNSRNMIRNKVEISTRTHSSNDALYVLL